MDSKEETKNCNRGYGGNQKNQDLLSQHDQSCYELIEPEQASLGVYRSPETRPSIYIMAPTLIFIYDS